MTVPSLSDLLQARPYPGRGVLAARLGADCLAIGYFLTGRSQASRQREFTALPNGDVAVRTTDPSAAEDALRHYVAVAERSGVLVVGNGSQVEPLAEALGNGADVLGAFSTHRFEPDPPIYTPRVWLTTHREHPDEVIFGCAFRSEHGSDANVTGAWSLTDLKIGEGVLLSTYAGTSTDVTTASAPTAFTVTADSPTALLDQVWDGLDPDLRVAALVLDSAAVSPAGVLIRT